MSDSDICSPKMVFKMSQEFLTVSLDITGDPESEKRKTCHNTQGFIPSSGYWYNNYDEQRAASISRPSVACWEEV